MQDVGVNYEGVPTCRDDGLEHLSSGTKASMELDTKEAKRGPKPRPPNFSLGNNLGELIDETLEIFEIHGGEDYLKDRNLLRDGLREASRGGFEASCLRQQ